MIALALSLFLAQSSYTSNSRVTRVERVPHGRALGGRTGGFGFAFFEAFPSSGAGMPAACSTTAPTGAKGEALTFTRASVATCTPTATGGLTTTGISTQSLVEVTNNVARVEYDANGVLGLLVESSRAQVLFRFIDFANALWSDIGTPTLTGSQTSPFSGTYATSAVQFDDNDGAAYEGRAQTVTVSAGVAHTMHCYVRAGTASSARITLDGTAATITGLSSSTWSIVEVTDASSSGVAIVAQVMVGDATSVTGTVTFGGCQVEAGSYRTSIMPSVAAGVTRAAETATFPGAALPANPYSLAASWYPPNATSTGDIFYGNSGSASGVGFFFVSGFLRAQNCSGTCANLSPGYSPPALTSTRLATSSTGGNQQVFVNGSSIAGPTAVTAAAAPWAAATGLGVGIGVGDAIISRICIDPDPSRCR